tara:strand:- start:37 stop:249 length:213 start_codon:yes stop_codon:yes gene_type:complete
VRSVATEVNNQLFTIACPHCVCNVVDRGFLLYDADSVIAELEDLDVMAPYGDSPIARSRVQVNAGSFSLL